MDDCLGTMAGITRGSTRSDLESAYAAEVGETTLGTEFTAGGLSGLLDGTGPTAYITTLWAGTTCAFRYIRTHATASGEGRGNRNDRQSVVQGKSVYVLVNLGGHRT